MASDRPTYPTRQLSLHNDHPTTLQQKRRTLRKQFSEDVPDIVEKHLEEKCSDMRISFSAKTRPLQPRVKVAWEEQNSPKESPAIIAKKCKEMRRPMLSMSRQNSFEREAILYPRQQLADQLRQAWKEKEIKEKQNLDIFLNYASGEVGQDGREQSGLETNKGQPKIVLPLQTEVLGNDSDLKNIFQKQIRKNGRNSNSPRAGAGRERPPATIVVPIIVPNDDDSSTKNKENRDSATPTPKAPSRSRQNSAQHRPSTPQRPIDVVIRPSTAASRRQVFQKRTNSAFNGSVAGNFRPPLVRASSLPTKPEQPKPKFTATKRRVRSAKRKETRNCDNASDADDAEFPSVKPSFVVPEIETMVSLVSPSASDTEEQANEGGGKARSRNVSPVKDGGKMEKFDEKKFSLRKVAKCGEFSRYMWWCKRFLWFLGKQKGVYESKVS